jgi:hypothetical protein
MSTHFKKGTPYQNRQRAAELHNNAAHAHLVGSERPGQQDHLTGHERSREAQEHNLQAFLNQPHVTPPTDEDIAKLAYELWQARGCPEGSAEEDWFQAAKQLSAKL